jgi:hypothetical protein
MQDLRVYYFAEGGPRSSWIYLGAVVRSTRVAGRIMWGFETSLHAAYMKSLFLPAVGPGIIWNYLQSPVRAARVTGRFVWGFQTSLQYPDTALQSSFKYIQAPLQLWKCSEILSENFHRLLKAPAVMVVSSIYWAIWHTGYSNCHTVETWVLVWKRFKAQLRSLCRSAENLQPGMVFFHQ